MVDPATLHLPTGIRSQEADPTKLARQISRHGISLDGMPPLEVVRGKDGHLRINDGVTGCLESGLSLRESAPPFEKRGTFSQRLALSRSERPLPALPLPRATRAAKFRPGELVPAEVIATLPNLDVTKTPRVGDTLS